MRHLVVERMLTAVDGILPDPCLQIPPIGVVTGILLLYADQGLDLSEGQGPVVERLSRSASYPDYRAARACTSASVSARS